MDEPIVLIGGFGSHWKNYRLFARYLANVSGRRVFITSITRSTWMLGGLTNYWLLVNRAHRAVQYALQHSGAEKVMLVGHSAGGIIGRGYLAERLSADHQPAYAGHAHVSRFIALGSPLRGVERPRHRGLHQAAWLDREFPGAHYAPAVQYLTVCGRRIEGKRIGLPEQRLAYSNYEYISGEGAQWGDGVVPDSVCRLEGAPHLQIDGIGHSPGWPRWYGSDEEAVRLWWHYFDEGDAPAQEMGRMVV